jgi:nucleoside-diphosphate-sugar epimerase
MRIAVTGSSGKLGRPTAELLRRQGHEVLGLDRGGDPGFGFTRVDLADYGQTLDSMLGVTARHDGLDAVVHLAAIPVNGMVPDAALFHQNMSVTFNVLHAALRARIRTIVYASSINVLGFPFTEPPAYLPLDEDSPLRANNTYGLAKVAEETIAAQLVRWEPDLSVTALRFTNVTRDGEYQGFAARHADPDYRRDLVWSYVDARDGAAAISLAVEQAAPGFRTYNIAASDTGLSIPSRDLVAGAFPGVPLREIGEFETLMSVDRARTELGFEPKHLWRDSVFPGGKDQPPGPPGPRRFSP